MTGNPGLAPRRWLFRAFVAIAAPVVAYFGAALVGSLWPANADWREAKEGIAVYVEDNGVHTGIVLPVRAASVDWRETVRADAIADPRFAGHGWIAFGWGDRDFYVNTPSWSEMNPFRTIAALAGAGTTVVHVEHVAEPVASRDVRRIVLRPDEYRRLAAFVRGSFDPEGPPPARGYGRHDAFYAATGRYNLFGTCNEWTGRALRTAGVRMGVWTPLAPSVMHWIDMP